MNSSSQVTVLSGLVRRNFLEDFPQHMLMEAQSDYRLVIGSSSLSMMFELNPIRNIDNLSAPLTEKCPVRIPFKQYDSDSTISIDWGDGNIQSIVLKANASNPLNLVEHVYADIKSQRFVTIKISGEFDSIDNNDKSDKSVNYFYQDIDVLGSAENFGEIGILYTVHQIGKLTKIISWGENSYKSLNNFCYNAKALVSIPADQMPMVNNAKYTFYGCINLTEIPSGFYLADNLMNATGMFMESGLSGETVKSLAIPHNLSVIDKMFYGSKISSKPDNFYVNRYKNVNYKSRTDSSQAFGNTLIPKDDQTTF